MAKDRLEGRPLDVPCGSGNDSQCSARSLLERALSPSHERDPLGDATARVTALITMVAAPEFLHTTTVPHLVHLLEVVLQDLRAAAPSPWAVDHDS